MLSDHVPSVFIRKAIAVQRFGFTKFILIAFEGLVVALDATIYTDASLRAPAAYHNQVWGHTNGLSSYQFWRRTELQINNSVCTMRIDLPTIVLGFTVVLWVKGNIAAHLCDYLKARMCWESYLLLTGAERLIYMVYLIH